MMNRLLLGSALLVGAASTAVEECNALKKYITDNNYTVCGADATCEQVLCQDSFLLPLSKASTMFQKFEDYEFKVKATVDLEPCGFLADNEEGDKSKTASMNFTVEMSYFKAGALEDKWTKWVAFNANEVKMISFKEIAEFAMGLYPAVTAKFNEPTERSALGYKKSYLLTDMSVNMDILFGDNMKSISTAGLTDVAAYAASKAVKVPKPVVSLNADYTSLCQSRESAAPTMSPITEKEAREAASSASGLPLAAGLFAMATALCF